MKTPLTSWHPETNILLHTQRPWALFKGNLESSVALKNTGCLLQWEHCPQKPPYYQPISPALKKAKSKYNQPLAFRGLQVSFILINLQCFQKPSEYKRAPELSAWGNLTAIQPSVHRNQTPAHTSRFSGSTVPKFHRNCFPSQHPYFLSPQVSVRILCWQQRKSYQCTVRVSWHFSHGFVQPLYSN